MEDMKSSGSHRFQGMGMSLGMCLGVGLGLSLGESLFGSQSVGMCVGTGVSMVLGMAIGAAKDKKVNAQMDGKGYVITGIEACPDKTFHVTIQDKSGKSQSVPVTKGEMETELFAVGDAVYLDEEGRIEQALDKE